MPLVSVIIPTRNRPQLVHRAIASVLAQTFQDFEIVVVVDGEDPATVVSLSSIGDARLRWFVCEESVGGAEARNVGVRMATSPWVALLDDDDEWLPSKLEDQLAEAKTARPNCLIVTRFIDKRPNADIVQPGLRPRPGQPISEYLFCETSALGFRNGFLQTSTWLAPREALLQVPFTKGLPRNQETDWLLRAVPALNLEVRVVWKVLALFPQRVQCRKNHQQKRLARYAQLGSERKPLYSQGAVLLHGWSFSARCQAFRGARLRLLAAAQNRLSKKAESLQGLSGFSSLVGLSFRMGGSVCVASCRMY